MKIEQLIAEVDTQSLTKEASNILKKILKDMQAKEIDEVFQ